MTDEDNLIRNCRYKDKCTKTWETLEDCQEVKYIKGLKIDLSTQNISKRKASSRVGTKIIEAVNSNSEIEPAQKNIYCARVRALITIAKQVRAVSLYDVLTLSPRKVVEIDREWLLEIIKFFNEAGIEVVERISTDRDCVFTKLDRIKHCEICGSQVSLVQNPTELGKEIANDRTFALEKGYVDIIKFKEENPGSQVSLG